MPTYAVVKDSRIVNVIFSNSKEDAEASVGLEVIETNGSPWTGWILNDDGVWRPARPYDSWVWDGDEWVPPVPIPTLGGYKYSWNEEEINWDKKEIENPYPSWVKNNNNDWVAPVPMPQDQYNYVWNEESLSWKKT